MAGLLPRISSAACDPSRIGIARSRMIRSGFSWAAIATACCPSAASPQMNQSSFSVSRVRSDWRIISQSSAIRILAISTLFPSRPGAGLRTIVRGDADLIGPLSMRKSGEWCKVRRRGGEGQTWRRVLPSSKGVALYEFPPLGAIGIWQAESELESDVFAALNERVFLEGVVLAIGKIGAIMAAAGFFTGQRRARDQCSEIVEVAQFEVG